MGQILRYTARQVVSNDLTTDNRNPKESEDEPEILRNSNHQFGLMGADAGHINRLDKFLVGAHLFAPHLLLG